MLMEDHEKGKKHPGTMRRHMKGDALCSVILLFLFFLLFYSHRRLTPQRDQTLPAKHGSTRYTPVLETNTKISERSSPIFPKSPQTKPHHPDPPNIKPPRPSDAPRPISTAVPPSHTSFDFADYLRKKDQRDFKLLIDQPAKCSDPDGPFLLIAVKSLASEFDKRQVVRRTWGREGVFQKKASVRRVFLLGVPQNQSALPLWDRLLAYESRSYGDILLWDFEDTFFNLTLKEIHFLRWVNTSCPQANFLFKGDADVFVNVDNVLQMLESQEPHGDLFVGDIIVNAKPIRRRTSKYFVPEFIYGQGVYPTYAGGGGFVMSGHTARKLQRACGEVELFPIDDVFLGMCLLRIGLQPTRHQGFRTFGIVRPSAAPHLQIFEPCFYRELMVVHSLTVPQIWLMWKLLHDPDLHCHGKQRVSPFPFRWGGKGEKSQAKARNDDYEMKVFVEH